MGALTAAQECSDCVLSGMVSDLNSYFGYSEDYEADFKSRTSSCSKSTYVYTIPGKYTLTPTTTVTTTSASTPTPTCYTTHTVAALDDCASIAQNYSVSSWSLVKLNGLNIQCSNMKPGDSLCIDIPCSVHLVDAFETCDSIVAGAGGNLTGNQLANWNPNIDVLCRNLHDIPSNVICVG
jgi:LysM repeat protein